MFKRAITIAVCLGLLGAVGSCGFKNRKGYYYDNHRFNYVRAEKFKDIGDRNLTQPYTFSEPEMSSILRMIEVNKGSFASKNVKVKEIFDSYAVQKLTPHIVKAFQEIGPDQRVGFGFLQKHPTFVLRNDRLSTGWMWVEDGKLHVLFDLIYVKITSDINKRGYTAIHQQVAKSRGLRISFDLQPGQEYGDSTKELVIEPSVYTMIAEKEKQKAEELATKGIDDTVKIEVVKDKTTKDRLKELKTLRKERMITEEEYQQKREAILNQL